MTFFKRKHPGFTLIETAIVLFIISLLMLLILPNLNTQRKKSGCNSCNRNGINRTIAN